MIDIGTLQAFFYLAAIGCGIFMVAVLAGYTFDGIQRRSYNNKKKWDREL